MYSKAIFKLETGESEKLSYQKAVVFQGVLMEQIDTEYADYLHESSLHPYSQNIESKAGENYWVINTLNKDAYENIIAPLLNLERCKVLHNQTEFAIVSKEVKSISKKEFTRKFYFEDSDRYINVLFSTPTAFKQDGKYINYPDLRLIYKNLMNKYDNSSENESVCNDELLEELVKSSQIVQYNLRSSSYSIEKYKIPAFIGKITVKINGAQSLVNFANMMFKFGEYSGIGIKTALGMGSIKVLERVVK